MNNNEEQGKCIAIVSGKGGSGKTMIAASMARVIDSKNLKVILIDADYGTAGLTYYMGLNTVPNISVGLTNLSALEEIDSKDVKKLMQPMNGFDNSVFIGIGDHRRHLKSPGDMDLDSFFNNVVSVCRNMADFVLIDCRGGIDDESLAVCKAVDDVIIIAETDTTSFQATQHLVDVLYGYDLSNKLSGFLINKVFDDPSTISRAGTASFKSQYLESVPFDLSATKSFLVGDLPSLRGMFTNQVCHALYKLYPEKIPAPSSRPLSFMDYRGLSIRDNESLLGGMMISFITLGIGMVLLFSELNYIERSKDAYLLMLFVLIFFGVISGIEPARKSVGRIFTIYKTMLERLFFK